LDYNQHAGIDLHIHTTASDGTFTPSEILAHAIKLKLKAIAITDHDTLAGSSAALNSGIPAALEFLTGVEISAAPPPFYHKAGSFHLLGYSIHLDDSELNLTLEKLQLARKNRNPAIINRLNELGISISLDEVREEAGDVQLGRPHIAQMMIRKGVVSSIDEAFDSFWAQINRLMWINIVSNVRKRLTPYWGPVASRYWPIRVCWNMKVKTSLMT